jgi:hypothetical protein
MAKLKLLTKPSIEGTEKIMSYFMEQSWCPNQNPKREHRRLILRIFSTSANLCVFTLPRIFKKWRSSHQTDMHIVTLSSSHLCKSWLSYPEEWERPPLETATKQQLMETVTLRTLVSVRQWFMKCSQELCVKEFNKPNYHSKPRLQSLHTRDYIVLDVLPCCSMEIHRHLGGKGCHILQGWRLNQARNQEEAEILKTSVNFHQITWCYIPDDFCIKCKFTFISQFWHKGEWYDVHAISRPIVR